MSDSTSRGKALTGVSRDAYLRCLQDEHVSNKSRPYYVTRLNQFLSAAANSDPATLNKHNIKRVITSFGCRNDLQDWQFAQFVDAVRIFFACYLKSHTAIEVDWNYWSSSAKAIGNDHASKGRNSRPEELLREKVCSGKGSLSKFRQEHEDLIVRVVTDIRAKGYAYKTEQVYEQWVCRYIDFCKGLSPQEAGPEMVVKFLNELVASDNVSASTQNQALNALVYLYKHVLQLPIGQFENLTRSKRKKTVPVVLTRKDVKNLLAQLEGWHLQVVSVLYGVDPRSGTVRQHHLHESGLQRAVKKAAQHSGITKRVGCHTFLHCFATHLLETGQDIRTVQ